jgi:hypothetical protein
MDIKDARIKRLLAEHFTPEESKRLANLNIPLNDPRMVAIRKERKDLYWQYKEQGYTKKDITKRVRFVNKAEGLTGQKGIEKKIERIPHEAATQSYYLEAKVKFERDAETRNRYRILRRAGFFPFEAEELAKMKTIDPKFRKQVFDSPTWQKMIRNHPTVLNGLINRAVIRTRQDPKASKLSDKQIAIIAVKMVRSVLIERKTNKEFSPFDWLRKDYKPPKPVDMAYKKQEESEKRYENIKKEVQHFKKNITKGQFWD